MFLIELNYFYEGGSIPELIWHLKPALCFHVLYSLNLEYLHIDGILLLFT